MATSYLIFSFKMVLPIALVEQANLAHVSMLPLPNSPQPLPQPLSTTPCLHTKAGSARLSL